MTSSESRDQLPGTEQVSRAYRAAKFDEAPPAAVDRTILAAARQARRRPLASYLPPLALAATLVLSVSLVLRSGVLNENTEIFSNEPVTAPASNTPPATTAIELNDAAETDEAATPQDSNALSDDADVADSLERSVAPQEGAAGTENLPELEPPARPVIELRARQVQPALTEEIAQDQQAAEPLAIESTAATAGVASFSQTGCSGDDREDPASWLDCITAIVTNGDEDDAREELAAFMEVYPDYELPADFEGALVP